MKLSSSSSLILATLAISSSSSSLAAPTTDAPEGGMTSSSSSQDVATRHDPSLRSVDNEEVANIDGTSTGKHFLSLTSYLLIVLRL
jgi:hypothetical protein